MYSWKRIWNEFIKSYGIRPKPVMPALDAPIICAFGMKSAISGFTTDESTVTLRDPVQVSDSGRQVYTDIVFDFKNGFSIAVRDVFCDNDAFKVSKGKQVFFSASFFEDSIQFPLVEHNRLVFVVTRYEDDIVGGAVWHSLADVEGAFAFDEIGKFELRRDGTTWRGKEMRTVFNRRRIAKEALLRGKG